MSYTTNYDLLKQRWVKKKSKGAQANELHWRQAEKAATLNLHNTNVAIYLQPATISCSYHMPPKSRPLLK